jgi:hypothetical protein
VCRFLAKQSLLVRTVGIAYAIRSLAMKIAAFVVPRNAAIALLT